MNMTATEAGTQVAEHVQNVQVGFNSLQSFELTQRAGKLLSSSTLVPKEFQGNLANCVIALNLASRIGADPLQVMQNLYVVHGKPGWSSQFLIATFNSCGRFTSMRFEFFGDKGKDDYGCRAYATEKSTGERLEGADVTISIAKKEGWFEKTGSKWKTMPQQMLMYRAAGWFVRAYAPELSMGLQTQEEIHDVYEATRVTDGMYDATQNKTRPSALAKIVAQSEPESEPQAQFEEESLPEQEEE